MTYEQLNQLDKKATQFVAKLHKLCDDVVAKPDDPFHDDAGNAIWLLYEWLYENHKINDDTTFAEVCNRVNAIAPYIFTLDLEMCDIANKHRISEFRKVYLDVLEYHRESVLSLFKVVFDLTCAGALMTVEEYS